ncbi:MAG: hypothetical protein K2J31_02410 [Alistipes sp.]|nr:hypothetical protein [Alistipes sp.]
MFICVFRQIAVICLLCHSEECGTHDVRISVLGDVHILFGNRIPDRETPTSQQCCSSE